MKKTRLSLNVEQMLYTDVIQALESHIGKIRVELGGVEIDTALITLKLENER